MNAKRVVTWGSILLAAVVWVVLAQYVIDDVLSLVIAVAVGLAGPVCFQAWELLRRRDSGTPGNRL